MLFIYYINVQNILHCRQYVAVDHKRSQFLVISSQSIYPSRENSLTASQPNPYHIPTTPPLHPTPNSNPFTQPPPKQLSTKFNSFTTTDALAPLPAPIRCDQPPSNTMTSPIVINPSPRLDQRHRIPQTVAYGDPSPYSPSHGGTAVVTHHRHRACP